MPHAPLPCFSEDDPVVDTESSRPCSCSSSASFVSARTIQSWILKEIHSGGLARRSVGFSEDDPVVDTESCTLQLRADPRCAVSARTIQSWILKVQAGESRSIRSCKFQRGRSSRGY